MIREIPRVDLADAMAPAARRREFSETVERGLREIGFVFVRTPGLARMLPAAYAAYAEVFARPAEELEQYRRPEIHHMRGYTPLGVETAAACRRSGADGEPQPDQRSCWLIGPESITDTTLRKRFPAFYADNVWPERAPDFQAGAVALFDALNAVGLAVLRALEPELGYADGFFDDLTRDASTALRPLCYPPVTAEQIGRVVWGCRHTDGNLVSVLPPSTGKGLHVKLRGGGWIDGTAPEGHTIVQVGDMLQYLTGGHLRSAVHRIDAPGGPTGRSRYSSPLFIYPRAEVDLRPDERWRANERKYRSITAAEFFEARLRTLGLGAAAA
ncbi:isopenicillin N synthase family oxygenase [Amycolatopsis sp. K13G38]|uniref:Isopenicillin N synthase family oxygenase n=1 Tax=Amycolatopsis acididurans TaxID=2724524 RepID=A0ABX1J3E0_9PSEU|nr:isopenicillin N synthase family oxygenase [Amycolatopsis acididurans]NKQ52870.1 isopenicillin N synthase family oxygenase [Amycolatopsis acididurans]